MPLSKSITASSGYAATYWIVTGIAVNPATQQVTFTFGGYKDQAAQAAGATAESSINISFTMDPTVLATVIAGGEAHALAAGLLSGATQS